MKPVAHIKNSYFRAKGALNLLPFQHIPQPNRYSVNKEYSKWV